MALVTLPDPEVVLSDDADQVIDIDSDDDLTGVPLLLTVRADPDWPRKTLPLDVHREDYEEEDLADWEAVFSSSTTTTPAAGHAAAVVISRANAALLMPGKLRYVAEIARTDAGNVSPVVPPFWVSVRSAVSRPA